MKHKPFFDENGNLIRRIPKQAVIDCSHSGRCDDDVIFWIKKLNFSAPRQKAISFLSEYGAWENLENDSDDDINNRVFWLLCGDIKENGECFGLNH